MKKIGVIIALILILSLSLSFVSASWFGDLLNSISGKKVLASPAGLIASYDFENNADDTLNNWDGVLKNGAGFADGKLKTDGVDDYVEIAYNSGMNLNQFSITAWVKWNGKYWNPVISRDDGATKRIFNFRTQGDNRIGLSVWNSANTAFTAVSNYDMRLGEWRHVAGVFDGSSLVVYINGVAGTPVAFSGNIAQNNMPLRIARGGGTNPYFYGEIDNLRIWNKALTREEIMAQEHQLPCTETDDGDDINNKGITTGYEIGTSNRIDREDYCSGASVVEFFCDKAGDYDWGEVNNAIQNCEFGCSEGACVQAPEKTEIDGCPYLSEEVRLKLDEIRNSRKISLNSDGTTSVQIEDFYTVTLIGAGEDNAHISVSNIYGTDIKQIKEGYTKKINGLFVKLISAEANDIKYSANLEVGENNLVLKEGEIAYRNDYVVVAYPTEDTGAILKVSQIANQTTGYSNDQVKFTEVISGDTYSATLTNDGVGTVAINGKVYDIRYYGASTIPDDDKYITIKRSSDGHTIFTFDCPEISNSVCQDLINQVKNPEDFELGDVQFVNWWHDSGFGSWNSHVYEYYNANWYAVPNSGNLNLFYDVKVFDEKNIDLNEMINELTDYPICQQQTYYADNKVYVCNHNVFTGSSNENWQVRKVIWKNKNVLISVWVSSKKSLTEEEAIRLAQIKVEDFIDSLKNNEYEYLDWKNFDIPELASTQIIDSLKKCSSEIEQMTDKYGDDCWTNWMCKTEPVICPEYGRQKTICLEGGCGLPKKEQIHECSPGICSGCYVPRWLGGDFNKCIPYGFRFAQPVEYENKLVEKTEEDMLMNVENDEYSLNVISDNTAELFLYSKMTSIVYNYTLTLNEITEMSIPDWEDKIENVRAFTKKINYNTQDSSQNYVVVDFSFSKWQNELKTINAYCDIDGETNMQKETMEDGSWEKCQNNYECRSNLCSNGECVDMTRAIKEVSGFKNFIMKILCGIGSVFGLNYEECVLG